MKSVAKIHIHKQLSKLISHYHKNNDICGTIQLNRFRNDMQSIDEIH